MKLQSIEIRDFRGVEHSKVSFGPGVTIVEGPNEVGKSTLAEALRLLRDEKATAKPKRVQDVQPVNRDVGPQATVVLTTGDYQLTYTKRWLKRAMAELTVRTLSTGATAHYTSVEAHEKYLDILRETCDLDLLSALESVQGKSLDDVSFMNLRVVRNALDATAGPGEDAESDAVLEAIAAEYGRYFTSTGRPTGEFAELGKAIPELKERVQSLEMASRELDDATGRYRTLEGGIAQRQADAQRNDEDLRVWQAKDAEATAAEKAVAAKCTEVERAQAVVNQLADREKQRKALVTKIDTLTRQVSELEQSKADAEQATSEAQQTVEQAKGDLEAAQSAYAQARQRTSRATRHLEMRRCQEDVERVGAQIARAESHALARSQAEAELGESPIDESFIEKLTEAYAMRDAYRHELEASAARMEVSVDGELPVEVNGQVLSAGEHSQALTDRTTISVPGVVRVSLTPAVPAAERENQLRRAEDAVTTLLKRGEVDSLEDAKQIAARRREARKRLDEAKSALTSILEDVSLEALRERHDRLQAKLDLASADEPRLGDAEVDGDAAGTADGNPAADSDAPWVAGDLSREQVEELVEVLRAQEVQAEAEVEAARARLMKVTEELSKGQNLQIQVRTTLDTTRASLDDLRAEDEAMARDDAEATLTIEQARAALEEANAAWKQAKAALDDLDPTTISMMLKNAEDAHERSARELDQARAERDRLSGVIETLSGNGIYDELEQARAELFDVKERHKNLQHAAEAVKLLRETMERHRSAAQAKHRQPFQAKIEELARPLFGSDFSVTIGDDLSIASRTLNGVTVPFSNLSAGAREQLGLIARLACATLIAADQGAPVILDDTLGFSDPERLTVMNAILNHVGRSCQVVILTCQSSRFSSIGGATTISLTRGSTAD